MTEFISRSEAIRDPSRYFNHPLDVCHSAAFSHAEKIKILRRWEYDAREMEVAEEENMSGGSFVHLDEVLKALQCVNAEIDLDHGPPTKQGGE